MKTLYAEFTVLPGHEARVAEMMATLAEHVRREPGNVQFLPFTETDNPRQYFIFEQYADADAFEAHITAPYGAVFNGELGEHIEGDASELTWLDASC